MAEGYHLYKRLIGEGEFEKVVQELITQDEDPEDEKFVFSTPEVDDSETYKLYVTAVRYGLESPPSNIVIVGEEPEEPTTGPPAPRELIVRAPATFFL